MNVLYPAVFDYDREDQRYTSSFPDFPEAISEAASLDEAYFISFNVDS